MKNRLLFLTIFSPGLIFSQVGISTKTPQRSLHVNGSLQITNELNVGGNATTAGSAGTKGQVLISNGPNVVPNWGGLSQSGASGILSGIAYLLGTNRINVSSGNTVDVPGLSYQIVVPNNVTSQTLAFTIIGYAPKSTNTGARSQGVFGLYKDNVKLTSAYTSVSSDNNASDGILVNLPNSCTLIYQITLTPGTYNFVVKYTSWSGTATINFIPSSYLGYNGDHQSMLSRMQVQVFNN